MQEYKCSYDFRRLNALIVDDNKHMRSLIRTIVNSLGIWQVQEAADGADAFEEMKTFPADFIICDLMMTPIDGIEFTQLIRNAKDSPNTFVPIIMLTGHTERQRVNAARDAGVDEFLAKPISAKGLYSRIVAIIEHRRPFVRSKAYFGPDRRRRIDPLFRGPWRRSTDLQDKSAADQSESKPRTEQTNDALTQDEIEALLNA